MSSQSYCYSEWVDPEDGEVGGLLEIRGNVATDEL